MTHANNKPKWRVINVGTLQPGVRGGLPLKPTRKRMDQGPLRDPADKGNPVLPRMLANLCGVDARPPVLLKALNGCWSVDLAGILLLLMMTLKRLIKRGHTGVE